MKKTNEKKPTPRYSRSRPGNGAKPMDFVHRVTFTTCLAFTLISFFYLIVLSTVVEYNASFTFTTHTRYTLGKLFCVFLFSLSLGFANRLPEKKKGKHALWRLVRFLAALVSYFVFMIVLFYNIFDSEKNMTVKGTLLNVILFLFFYFVTIGVTALGRKILYKGEDKPYKSILD